MPYYNDSGSDNKEPRAGLLILGYAIRALKEHRVTARQAILLGHVDRWINPFRTRHGEAEKDDLERVESVLFRTRTLCRILHADNDTVRRAIVSLCSMRPQLLKARKANRLVWRLKTRQRQETNDGCLYIPPPIRQAFEGGKLTPAETILLAQVASFTRCGRLSFATNKWWASFLGVSTSRAAQIISGLVAKGRLVSQLVRNGELRQLVSEHEGTLPVRFARNGKRTGRLLWPTDTKLYEQFRDWPAAPKKIRDQMESEWENHEFDGW